MPTLLNFLYEFKTDKHVTQYQECPRSPNRKRILARNHSKIRPPSQKMGSFQIKKRIFLNTDRATTQGQQFIPCGMHVCMYVIKVWAQTAAPILPLFPVCCVWILVVIHTRAQERARSINRTLFIIHMKKKKKLFPNNFGNLQPLQLIVFALPEQWRDGRTFAGRVALPEMAQKGSCRGVKEL